VKVGCSHGIRKENGDIGGTKRKTACSLGKGKKIRHPTPPTNPNKKKNRRSKFSGIGTKIKEGGGRNKFWGRGHRKKPETRVYLEATGLDERRKKGETGGGRKENQGSKKGMVEVSRWGESTKNRRGNLI